MPKQGSLSERINYAMEKQGLQQADLARMTGLSTAVISQIVSGKTENPTFSKVVLIAKALNVPIDYLAGNISYAVIKIPKK